MRITVHIKDSLNDDIKRITANEHKSVSSLVAESLEHYIKEKKRRKAGTDLLKLAGNAYVAEDVLKTLDAWRSEDDRT
ncbi:MAG: hypothetical protein NTX75_10065 [Proteobacteria bacterium]|nr:hypothetical protein [Pseudomonadota bacterium]